MAAVTERLATLEERVSANILFFRCVLGAVVLWFAWISVQVYQMHGDLQRLTEPERLGTLAKVSPKQALTKLAAADPTILSQSLPALQTVIARPASQISPNPNVLLAVAEKLRQIPDTNPNYWPAVLRFIQFASTGMSGNAPAAGPPDFTISNTTCTGLAHCIVASGKRVVLDGGSIPNSQFVNCRIIFTEKPVNLKGTVFINCIFEMPMVSDPNPYLRDASRLLLASDFKTITVNASLG